jgi:hypothetical protein
LCCCCCCCCLCCTALKVAALRNPVTNLPAMASVSGTTQAGLPAFLELSLPVYDSRTMPPC